MEAIAQMSEIHEENLTWINNLRFYENEISVMNARLEEVASRNKSYEVMAQVEHFQNQFIRQREVVDEIKHHVRVSDRVLYDSVQGIAGSSESRLFYSHDGLKDSYDTFEKLYYELKDDFEHFYRQTV
jgi:hypothetical protein